MTPGPGRATLKDTVAHRMQESITSFSNLPSPLPGAAESPGDSGLKALPGWIPSPVGDLFAWWFGPDDDRTRSTVVMCAALGSDEGPEGRKAYWMLAELLADRGLASMRFDYHGTGDSSGSWSDPDRVAAWQSSVVSACETARSTGSTSVILVGMRLGAIIAARAARCLKVPPSALVLWDPCSSGRQYLRQQMMLAATYGATQPSDGSVAGLAYTFPDTLVAEIHRLNLTESLDVDRQPVLLLAKRAKPLKDAMKLVASSPNGRFVEISEPDDRLYTSLLTPLTGDGMVEVADWIANRASSDRRSVTSPDQLGASVDQITLTRDPISPQVVIEKTATFGPNRLFAIVTEPGTPDEPRATAVFLSAGALDHIGPGRLWTDLARSWAREGMRCVRFDIGGLGDSNAWPGCERGVVRPPEAIDDILEVASALGAPEEAHLIFVGLSSGAYHALEAGLHVQPTAVIAINGSTLHNAPEVESGHPKDPRRMADRSMPSPFRRLAVEHKRIAYWTWRAISSLIPGSTPFDVLRDIGNRGTAVLCLCCEAERARWYNTVWGGLFGLPRNVRFEVLSGSDHSLYTASGRCEAVEVMNDFLFRTVLPALGGGEMASAMATHP